jgi:SPP1 family predicted phage head-tail adaptor
MNAGLFNRHITLTIPSGSAVVDVYGQSEYNFYTSSLWAKVDNKTGTQEDTGGILHDVAQLDFIIRYRDDVDEDCTITYDNQTYRILFIDDLIKYGRDRYMRLVGSRRN